MNETDLLQEYKRSLINEFGSALGTLHACIVKCPEKSWQAPVGTHPFSQTAFHVLFFTDFYLDEKEGEFRLQSFHREHATFFGDYEQLEDREPTARYEKADVLRYLDHCREKAATAIGNESLETLCGASGFSRRKMSRAELHVYNLRHIQHHAAHLSLRLRIDAGIDIPWFSTGWKDS